MAFDPVTALWAKNKATGDAKAYTDEVAKKLAGGLRYKGSVDTYNKLPISGNQLGYMYTTKDTGHEWVWQIEATSGTLNDWLDISQNLEGYYKKTETYNRVEIDTKLDTKQNIITDLDTIRSGAALGATSLQQADKTELQNNITQEVNDRTTAINTVNESINQEAITREQADTTLQTNINTKQDIISDLADIRDGAAKGKTAIQEHQDISGKLNKLPNVDDPTDPGYGYPYWIPYNFSTAVDANKVDITLKTLTLDNQLLKHEFTNSFPAATITSAGTMSAADKVSLGNKQDKLTAGTNISITDKNVISADKNAYNYINQIADYLFEVEYSTENIDYTYANKYFKDQPPVLSGACTGVYKDGRVLRHLDWYYNNEVEFLVRRTADPDNNIHASIGLATGIKGLTKSVVESGVYDRKFKMAPFLLTDGINDAGLYIQSNVVPALSNSYDINPDITAEDKQCCTTMLNRTILDRCASFAEVETLLNTYHIYGTSAIEFGSHFLIAQGTEWEIIELTHDGHFTVTKGTGANQMPNGIISNFRTTGLSFTGNAINWNSVEEYGLGVERFDIATAAFTNDVSLEDLRNDLKFTKLYTELQKGARWNTDYCGEVGTHGEKLKVSDAIDHEEYFDDLFTTNAANYQARTREDGKGTWQTTHSAIYDLINKSLSFCIQERTDELFNFGLNTERNDNSVKQDTLIAGNNISIATDKKTISAVDTKYTITIDL